MPELTAEPPVAPEQPAGPPAGARERRAHPRGRCRRGAAVRYVACPSVRPDWAEVADLSAGGVRLVLTGAPAPGQALLVQLSRYGGPDALTRIARVVHAAPGPEWGWAAGCRFDRPLSGEDLAAARDAIGLRG